MRFVTHTNIWLWACLMKSHPEKRFGIAHLTSLCFQWKAVFENIWVTMTFSSSTSNLVKFCSEDHSICLLRSSKFQCLHTYISLLPFTKIYEVQACSQVWNIFDLFFTLEWLCVSFRFGFRRDFILTRRTRYKNLNIIK